jgi:hypothetical protein
MLGKASKFSKAWKKRGFVFQALENRSVISSNPWKNHPVPFQSLENSLPSQHSGLHEVRNVAGGGVQSLGFADEVAARVEGEHEFVAG